MVHSFEEFGGSLCCQPVPLEVNPFWVNLPDGLAQSRSIAVSHRVIINFELLLASFPLHNADWFRHEVQFLALREVGSERGAVS